MPERKRTNMIMFGIGCLTRLLALVRVDLSSANRPKRHRRDSVSVTLGRSALQQWQTSGARRWLAFTFACTIVGTVCLSLFQPLAAQETVARPLPSPGLFEQAQIGPGFLEQMGGPDVWTSPEGLSSALQIMFLLTVLSMAPAILLMTTSGVKP